MIRQPLRREKQIANTVNETIYHDLDFADQVANTLGYTRLKSQQKDQIETEKRDKRIAEEDKQLLTALKELDIMPFTKVSIAKYKKMRVRQATPRVNKIFDWAIALLVISGTIAATSLLTGMIMHAMHMEAAQTAFIGCLMAIPAVICIIVGCCVENDVQNIEKRWETYGFPNYDKDIPEFVLQSALDIKEKCPDLDLQFRIEELRLIHLPRPRIPDPFLVVNVAYGPWRYIEVWNEPGFKAERMV